MGLPLFPSTSEEIAQELLTKLQPLNQLLRASTKIPNYLTYKARIVSLTQDSSVLFLHTLQTKNLPPSTSTSPRAFLSFATENEQLQSQIHAKEWESHFLLSPKKLEQSLIPLLQNSQTRLALPQAPFDPLTYTPNPTLTNVQICNCYTLLLASITSPQNFRQPNGLGRNSRSFTEKRFRDNVLAYSCVQERERSPSVIPPRLRPRKNWCHVLGGWSGRGVKMVRVVPLQLVSKKLASLFASWEGGGGEFEGLFLEGGNGIALHEPFAIAVSRGILVLIPSSLDEAGDPAGYTFILADQTYAEKDTGQGPAKNFHNLLFRPSPLNNHNLPSPKFIYFRLLLTYITHLHLGKPTEWFMTLLQTRPGLFKPRHPPFRGEMLRFLLDFAGADWGTKQALRGLMDDGGMIMGGNRGKEREGEKELDWKEAEKMARGIKVDCVSFGVETERKRIEEEQKSLVVAVDGLYEVGEGASATNIRDGNGGQNQIAGFLIRVVLDDADDERETRDIVLSDRDEGVDIGVDEGSTGRTLTLNEYGFLDEGFY